MLPIITSAAIPGRSGITLMARILGNTGEPITQASISSIAYTVTDLSDDNTEITTGTFTVSASVFDNLQQADLAWTKDDVDNKGSDGRYGYNFKATVAATIVTIALSGHTFQVDVRFTPASGQPFIVAFRVATLKIFA